MKDSVYRLNIDWENFLADHDLIWTKIPKGWGEAPFLGNGMLGAVLYQEPDSKTIKLDIGRSDVRDYRKLPQKEPWNILFNKPRLPIGYFAYNLKGEITKIDWRLDLWNAKLRGLIETTVGSIKFELFVHSIDMIIYLHILEVTGKEDSDWFMVPAKPISPRQLLRPINNYIHNPDPVLSTIETILPKTKRKEEDITEEMIKVGISTQTMLAGGETITAWTKEDFLNEKEEADDTDDTDDILKGYLFKITVSHDRIDSKVLKEALDVISSATIKGYERIIAEHESWWHNYYPKSFLSIPDAVLESFYWIQMYKLASGTRGDRAILDLQGPWLQPTIWPATWWNLNIQLTYWSTITSNRCELFESLWRTLDKNKQNLINNVEEPYRHDSAAIGRRSAMDLDSPVKVPGRDNDKTTDIGSLTWTLHNCWLYYRMNMDDTYLEEFLYPLLRRSINYYIHFLYKDEEGRYHLPPTASPEYPITTKDCNYDLSLIRWGCITLIEICNRLSIDDELIDVWTEILDKLIDYPGDENEGFYIGADVRYEMSHRHYSHLLMIYPLYLVNIEQGEEALHMIERSLEYWHSKPEALFAYSFTGASSISAAIGKGNDALNYLKRLWDGFLLPNTMYTEAGPVIETPLSAAQAMHDMLIQSWGGKIRIFPAVPDEWEDLVFHDFLAEGAFLISAIRHKGKTTFIKVKSLKGEECFIKTASISDLEVYSKNGVNFSYIDEDIIKLDLRKGEEAFLLRKGYSDDFIIEPCGSRKGLVNYYGLRD